MKKLLLLSVAFAVGISAQAQTYKKLDAELPAGLEVRSKEIIAERTEKTGDTIKGVLNFSSTQFNSDSLIAIRVGTAPYDSGYAFGTSAFEDKGYAERFDYNGKDSGLEVIGTLVIFDGVYTPTTTKTVNFKVWSQGPTTTVTGRPRLFYNGVPNTVLTTQPNVSIKNLGINMASKNDTLTFIKFTTPTAYLRDSFFVGFDINYTFSALAGDTIAIKTTRSGYRYSPYYFVQGADTVRNVKNAAQYKDNVWHDNAYDNYGLGLHYAIFPYLVVKVSTGVNGVSHNNLQFFGSSPNPTTTTSNIHYALKHAADVTITLMDEAGRTIRTMTYPRQSIGDHYQPLDISALAAGTYMYLLRTSDGDGMASRVTVSK